MNNDQKSLMKDLAEALERKDVNSIISMWDATGQSFSHLNVAWITLHKLTIENLRVSRERRLESARWLKQRGYSRINGGDPMEALKQ